MARPATALLLPAMESKASAALRGRREGQKNTKSALHLLTSLYTDVKTFSHHIISVYFMVKTSVLDIFTFFFFSQKAIFIIFPQSLEDV